MTTGHLRALAVALALAGTWLAAAPAEGQRTSPVRIGALTESWGPTTLLVGLRDGLQELGYREDRDFSIGVRFTQGDHGSLLSPVASPAATAEMQGEMASLLVSQGAAVQISNPSVIRTQ